MDDNGMDEGEDYEVSYDETDEDTAINVESGTVVSGDETYLRVDQAGNDALLRQMSLPIIQNVTFVFGINGNYESYNYMEDEYWVKELLIITAVLPRQVWSSSLPWHCWRLSCKISLLSNCGNTGFSVCQQK